MQMLNTEASLIQVLNFWFALILEKLTVIKLSIIMSACHSLHLTNLIPTPDDDM